MASTTLTAASSILARGSGGRSSVSGIAATVFGGTGFLGRYVVNQLGRIGSQVSTPYRGDELYSRHLKVMGDLGQIIPMPFELRDEDSVRDAIRGSSVVINLLGKHFETPNYKFADVHVDGAKRIAEIAKDEGVDHFVHVSSVPGLKECASAWMTTKLEGEMAVREVYPGATIVRPTDMFGSEDRLLTRMADNVMRMRLIPLANDGESKIQPIWVNDVASVVGAAARDPERFGGKTLELAGPDIITVRELYDYVCTDIKRETGFLPVPSQLMKMGTKLTSLRLPIINPNPLYTPDCVEMETSNRILDTEKEGVMRMEDLECYAISVFSDTASEVMRRFRKGGDRSSLFYVD